MVKKAPYQFYLSQVFHLIWLLQMKVKVSTLKEIYHIYRMVNM